MELEVEEIRRNWLTKKEMALLKYIRLYNLYHRCKGCRVKNCNIANKRCRIYTKDFELNPKIDFSKLVEVEEQLKQNPYDLREVWTRNSAYYELDENGEVKKIVITSLL